MTNFSLCFFSRDLFYPNFHSFNWSFCLWKCSCWERRFHEFRVSIKSVISIMFSWQLSHFVYVKTVHCNNIFSFYVISVRQVVERLCISRFQITYLSVCKFCWPRSIHAPFFTQSWWCTDRKGRSLDQYWFKILAPSQKVNIVSA